MKEMIRDLYSVRRQEQENYPETKKRAQGDGGNDSTGTLALEPVSPMKTRRSSLRGIESDTGMNRSMRHVGKTVSQGMQCPHCGETFPVTDYHYTEHTGLCISCWEGVVCKCQ